MTLYPQQVMKRDGRLQPFDAEKITQAVAAAGRASGEFGDDEARRLTENGVLPELSSENNTADVPLMLNGDGTIDVGVP